MTILGDMNAIARLKREFDISTHVEEGKVTFSGVFPWTNAYRRACGKDESWPEIQSLMREAETAIASGYY